MAERSVTMAKGTADLAVTVFFGSAAALMLEIVAGRLIAPYVGTSLHSWTAIIAVVLAGLSLGHLLGGRLAEGATAESGRLRLALATAVAAATTLSVLWLLRLLASSLLDRGLSPITEVVALALGLLLLPSVAAGVIGPLATKIAIDHDPERTGAVLGRMFALGATGSILGTLASGFLLVAWLGSTRSVLVIAGVYAALSLLLAVGSRRRAVLSLAALAVGFLAQWPVLDRWEALTSPCHAESAYHCVRVDPLDHLTGRPSAALVLDHLAHGINDRDDPQLLYSAYLHFTDLLARSRFGDQPLRAFMIGGGAFTLPRAWSRPGARIVVAEIDPLVTEIAIRRLWVQPRDSLEIVHLDARRALAVTEGQFDVILGRCLSGFERATAFVDGGTCARGGRQIGREWLLCGQSRRCAARPRFVAQFHSQLAGGLRTRFRVARRGQSRHGRARDLYGRERVLALARRGPGRQRRQRSGLAGALARHDRFFGGSHAAHR